MTAYSESSHIKSFTPNDLAKAVEKMERTEAIFKKYTTRRESKNKVSKIDDPQRRYPRISFKTQVSAVTKRNERERHRVRLVNEGFSCLRQKIPFTNGKKRLSKVETLRCAVNYIKHLQRIIKEYDEEFLKGVVKTENSDINQGLLPRHTQQKRKI